MGAFVFLLFGASEYVLAVMIGMPTLVGVVAALQVGIVAAMLVWLGGVPGGGYGLGRRW
jgi:hypothetical protein